MMMKMKIKMMMSTYIKLISLDMMDVSVVVVTNMAANVYGMDKKYANYV